MKNSEYVDKAKASSKKASSKKRTSAKYDVVVKAKATSTKIVEITNDETVMQCVKFRRIENY